MDYYAISKMTRHFYATPLCACFVLLCAGAGMRACGQVAIQTIIDDMTLPHEAELSGVPSSLTWSSKPRLNSSQPPEGWTCVTAWGQIYREAEQPIPDNTRIQIRDFEAYQLKKSDGTWVKLQDSESTGIQGGAWAEDYAENKAKAPNLRDEENNSVSVKLEMGYNYHFWPYPGRECEKYDENDVGALFTVFKARLILDDPNGVDDREHARLLGGSGGDYWRSPSAQWKSDWSNNFDFAIGRLKFVTEDWQYFTACTYEPIHTIGENPPPPAGDAIPPVCGNGECESGEGCSSCPQDCGECPTVDAFSRIHAVDYSVQSGTQKESCSEGGQSIGYAENGDWILFKNVDFGDGGNTIDARVASAENDGAFDIVLDNPDGSKVGTISTSSTGGWQAWKTVAAEIDNTTGNHDLYLKWTGNPLNLSWFQFSHADAVGLTGRDSYSTRSAALRLDGQILYLSDRKSTQLTLLLHRVNGERVAALKTTAAAVPVRRVLPEESFGVYVITLVYPGNARQSIRVVAGSGGINSIED